MTTADAATTATIGRSTFRVTSAKRDEARAQWFVMLEGLRGATHALVLRDRGVSTLVSGTRGRDLSTASVVLA